MFYFILSLLFLLGFFFIGKENMPKVLKYAFYSIIAIFFLVDAFAFIETERALKGQELTYVAYYDPGQATRLNTTLGIQSGDADDVRYIDNRYANITQSILSLPYLETTVTLDNISDFDTVIIVGNYNGNISVSMVARDGFDVQLGTMYSNTQSTTFNLGGFFDPSTIINDGRVIIKFQDNTLFGDYNLSLNYVGVNNRKETKSYSQEGEDLQFITAMHLNDYAGLILLSSMLQPAALLFITLLSYHFLSGWYDNYQGGQKKKKDY